MSRNPMNIFLDFLNKDIQEIYGVHNALPSLIPFLNKGLNASVLLCDVETYCFLPLGFWFESTYTRRSLYRNYEYIKNGLIRFSARENSIFEFVEKKREQYYPFKKLYPNFFNDTILNQLLSLNPILIDRKTRIGQFCTNQWKNDHIQFLNDNSGSLTPIYQLISDYNDRESIAKLVVCAANDIESPFIWTKVKNLISNFSIRDKQLEKGLRIHFEKNYRNIYLQEYNATYLKNFYYIDKGITFDYNIDTYSIANFLLFEKYLKYLDLAEILDATANKIVKIKNNISWAYLFQKYVVICNVPERFDFACGQIKKEPDWPEIVDSINCIKELLNMNDVLHIVELHSPYDKIDVLIMVATLEEEKAIVEHDCWKKNQTDDGYEYYTHFEGLNFAIARSISMGMENCASATQYYVDKLNPRFLAMAGFSAGKRGSVNLGDVIIPEKIFSYCNGKQTSNNSILPELNMFRIDYLWKQKVERFSNDWKKTVTILKPPQYESQEYVFLKKMIDNNFSIDINELKNSTDLPDMPKIINEHMEEGFLQLNDKYLIATENGKKQFNKKYHIDYYNGYKEPEPCAKIGVLATGNSVQEWDGIFEKLQKEIDRKICVLDMEGYAISDVAKFNHIPYIIAKGVGDFASKQKNFDNRYIPYSVFSAYRFLVFFFNDLKGSELLGR